MAMSRWTNNTEEAAIVRAYTGNARLVMREFMTINSCIGSARVTLDFLERYGISARVQPVKFVVEWKDKNVAYTSGLTESERSSALGQRQAYADGWNGHLIVIAGNRWIIDPSFDQAVAALGILPPAEMLCLESDRIGDARIEAEAVAVMDSGEELKIRYIPLDDDSYCATEAWNDIGLPFLVSEIATKLFANYGQAGRWTNNA